MQRSEELAAVLREKCHNMAIVVDGSCVTAVYRYTATIDAGQGATEIEEKFIKETIRVSKKLAEAAR